jgi:stress response protein YsnF
MAQLRQHRRLALAASQRERCWYNSLIEELEVRKHTVETRRVRITKVVHEHEELVDEPVLREEVLIERVPINRYIEAPIPLRYEGDTMIISLLKRGAGD